MILKREEVGQGLLKTLRPKMRAGLGVDELRVDPDAVLVSLHRSFEHVTNAEFLADLRRVHALALVGEGRVSRAHEAALDARKVGCEVIGDAIGEIILGGIAREIGERQHHDREVRGDRLARLGRRQIARLNRYGLRGGQVRPVASNRFEAVPEIPDCACGDQNQSGNAGYRRDARIWAGDDGLVGVRSLIDRTPNFADLLDTDPDDPGFAALRRNELLGRPLGDRRRSAAPSAASSRPASPGRNRNVRAATGDAQAGRAKKILCGWTAARLGRLSFHTSMEATDAVRHLRDRCRDHRPRE